MKQLLKIWLFSFFLGFNSRSEAQTVIVLDQETKKPLELATLVSKNTQSYAVTNAQGEADITSFPDSATIEIRSMGYWPTTVTSRKLEKTDYTWFLVPYPFSLDQVIISATRWKQSKQETPSRVTTITPKEAALQNPQTAADLLESSGEVFIQKSQLGGGSPMIRGFSTNRLVYTVDGVRMNNAIFRSGNLQNIISLDPFAIKQAEVLFGPGSVMYGSDAIGAVMSFQTLRPQLSETGGTVTQGNLVARYASANQERTAHFDISVGGEKWAVLTSFSSNQFDDLRMGRHGPDEYKRLFYVTRQDGQDRVVDNKDELLQVPTGYSQMNLMQKLRFKPNKSWEFQYGFHYSETSDYARYDRLSRIQNGLPVYAEWRYGPQVWMMNVLEAKYTGNDAFFDQASIRIAHQYFEESRIDRDFQSPNRRTRTEQVDAFSLNMDFKKDLSGRTSIFYGLEAVLNQVDSKGSEVNINSKVANQSPARYPLATWASYAAYATFQHELSDMLRIQAGARYNAFSLQADFSRNLPFYPLPFENANLQNAALTGSTGFLYGEKNRWSISLHLSTGFRAPNVDDVGKVFDSEPGAVSVPNPNLDAEYAYNAEFGFFKVVGRYFKLDASAYYTRLNNALVRRNFILNGQDSLFYDGTLSRIQAVQNASRTNVMGVQAGFEWYLPAGFSLTSQVNIQSGEEDLENGKSVPSRHAAPWFGVTRLIYENRDLSLQLSLQYNGEKEFKQLAPSEQAKPELYARNENGNPYAPGWYTLNLKVLYHLNALFSVSTGVENITDQRYRTYSSGIAAPGRNFIMAFRANFR